MDMMGKAGADGMDDSEEFDEGEKKVAAKGGTNYEDFGIICNPAHVMEIPVIKAFKDQEERERNERKEHLEEKLKTYARRLAELGDEEIDGKRIL